MNGVDVASTSLGPGMDGAGVTKVHYRACAAVRPGNKLCPLVEGLAFVEAEVLEARLLQDAAAGRVIGQRVRADLADLGLAQQPFGERRYRLAAVALAAAGRGQAVADLDAPCLIDRPVGAAVADDRAADHDEPTG